jgi:hypothetical protein
MIRERETLTKKTNVSSQQFDYRQKLKYGQIFVSKQIFY